MKAETYFRGYSYFGAFEYRRNGGDITVVNVLSMDDYLQGVIVQEMSPLMAPGGIESPDGLRPQLRLWKAPGGQAPEPGLRPVQHH